MKKTLSFEKDLSLKTKIGEVTTIDFEEDLKFTDKNSIDGNFYISGKYKMHEASTIEEDFSFSVPITISLLENYELESAKISIDNFTYEVIDDSILRAKITVLIEGREEVLLEEKEERECDSDEIPEDLKELPIKEEKIEQEEKTEQEENQAENDIKEEREKYEKVEVEEKQETTTENIEKEEKIVKVNSLFSNLGDELDTFTTYSVYIMREGDTLEKVMDKYKVTKEDLETYNDLSSIELNSKVIIPTNNE